MTYKRILIATDYSEPSEAAAEFALRLGDDKTRYRVVHVAPLVEMPERVDVNADIQRSNLLAWCDKVGLPSSEQVVLYGSAAKEIIREAQAMEADLIIVGHTGRGRIERLLLGSTARSAVRLATCDTLVTRGKPGPGPFRDILVATDFYEPGQRAAHRARSLAKESRASLGVVHAIDPDIWQQALRTPPKQMSNASDWLDQTYSDMLHKFNQEHLDGAAKEHLTRGNPAKAVAEQVALQGADLLVVGTHGSGAVERLLIGAHAESIIERTPCSVLVVR